MDRLSQIQDLSGAVDTRQFFVKNPLVDLSEKELKALAVKVSILNIEYKLDGLQAQVSGELQGRENRKRDWWNLLISITALIIAFASTVYTALAYYK